MSRSILSRPMPRPKAYGTTRHEPRYSEYLELDLSSVVPSIAGPKRPQDRVALSSACPAFRKELARMQCAERSGARDASWDQSFPASDVPSSTPPTLQSANIPTPFADGSQANLDHGLVAIAATTSCTCTSIPSVMLAAALLANEAVELG